MPDQLDCQDIGCRPAPEPDPDEDRSSMFPELKVIPRPEPDLTMKDDHNVWLQEYHQWHALRCPCGQGYFCREHGSWISGIDVRSGKAPVADSQQKGSCPGYHYEG